MDDGLGAFAICTGHRGNETHVIEKAWKEPGCEPRQMRTVRSPDEDAIFVPSGDQVHAGTQLV